MGRMGGTVVVNDETLPWVVTVTTGHPGRGESTAVLPDHEYREGAVNAVAQVAEMFASEWSQAGRVHRRTRYGVDSQTFTDTDTGESATYRAAPATVAERGRTHRFV